MNKDIILKTIWVLGAIYEASKTNKDTKISDIRKIVQAKIDYENSFKSYTKILMSDDEYLLILEELFNCSVIYGGSINGENTASFNLSENVIENPQGIHQIISKTVLSKL